VDEKGLTRYGAGSMGLDATKGTFELQNVIPGSYLVMAVGGGNGRQASAKTRIEVGTSDVDGIILNIVRGADLRGRFTVEGTASVDITGLGLNLMSPEREVGIQGGRMTGVSSDGTFTMSDVPEGTYDVQVTGGYRGVYLKSITADGQDVLENGMTVGPAGLKGSIAVVFSSAGAVVDGVVTDADGQAVQGATVGLAPDGDKRKLYRFYAGTVTDQYGRFVFRDVRPGDFKVFSWASAPGDWQDPDFLTPIDDKGVRVSTAENDHKTVQLQVIPVSGQPR
jgi:hypothetical protein